MKVRATGSFPKWLSSIKHDARIDNPSAAERHPARLRLDRINAFLLVLARMPAPPTNDDPPLLKRIRQPSRYPLWRLGHPFHPETCVRLIVHLHEQVAVVALVGGDKRGVSDQWYDAAVPRSEAILDHYYRQEENRQ